jgi:hypothetical protein
MILLIGYTTNCFSQDLTPGDLNDTIPIYSVATINVSTRIKRFNAAYLTDVVGPKFMRERERIH